MKNWKVWLALFLVFFAGMVLGVVATRVVTRGIIRFAIQHPDALRERIERDLVRKLKLDADQRAKVHVTLTDAQKELADLRKDFEPRFIVIMSNAQDQISATLTPEQRDKFEKIKAENRRIFPR